MLKCDREYKEKMDMGKKMYEYVKEYDIDEKSIPKEMREPLEIYKEQKQNVDVENVILKSWQESLLNYMKPSDREIIWVQGRRCGEGKSWFQEYVESRFGFKRVVAGMDIKLKKSSICHALRKRRLATTDIFLFDVGKAKTFDTVNYEVLEKLKNGRILASKFDSVELKLRTPNIVVVFSNDRPDVNQLAHDRWKIFSIEDEDLVEKPLKQSKRSSPTVEKNKNSTNFNWKRKKGSTYIYDDVAKTYTLENVNVIEESSSELEKDCSGVEQVDDNTPENGNVNNEGSSELEKGYSEQEDEKISKEMSPTLSSSDANAIERNSADTDFNEKVDERVSEDIVEYPLVINKGVDTNKSLVKKRRFKITDISPLRKNTILSEL